MDKENIRKFLGIDFGKSKIGLSMADSETKIAFSYKVIKNNGSFVENLKKILKTEDINEIVLGITASYKKDKKNYEAITNFGSKLSLEILIKVNYQEEMFTTKMAQANIIEKGGQIKSDEDKEASRIILQSWIDSNL